MCIRDRHEAWGLDEVMRRQADHLAELGYLVVAPDLYCDGGGLRCVRQVMAAICLLYTSRCV